MKAFSLTLTLFLSFIFFSSTALADIVKETRPDGTIARVKFIPDGAIFRKRTAPDGNRDCAQWCAANFSPQPGSACTSLAAHGEGPCYICGPRKSSSTEMLCGGACSETFSDPNNCGGCGIVCPSGTCTSGACTCAEPCTPPNICQNGQCCAPAGAPCTQSNFPRVCCPFAGGTTECEFPTGDPNKGYCVS